MPFKLTARNGYLFVSLHGVCYEDDGPSIVKSVADMSQSTKIVNAIVHCGDCGRMSKLFMVQIAQVENILREAGGQLRVIESSHELLDMIKLNGLDRVLVNKYNLRDALIDLGLSQVAMLDVNFINPFLNATQLVFKQQCGLESKALKPFTKKATDPLLFGDVSGIISITSEAFSGSLAVSLPEAVFLKAATIGLGEEVKEISEQNIDVVAELANMILGQAKPALLVLGYHIQMALPSCAWAKDYKSKKFGKGYCVAIPFQTAAGTFYSEVMTATALPKFLMRKKAA